jgi:hypothetical protein
MVVERKGHFTAKSFCMTVEEIAPWLEREVTVTLEDGLTYAGWLYDTEEPGLYHIAVGTGRRPDLVAHEIVKIEAKG